MCLMCVMCLMCFDVFDVFVGGVQDVWDDDLWGTTSSGPTAPAASGVNDFDDFFGDAAPPKK